MAASASVAAAALASRARRRAASPPAPALELLDIQGNILRPYNFALARHFFLRVHDAARGRRFVDALAGNITTAAPWPGTKPAATVNVAFTWYGLAALGVPERTLATFPEDFRAGMRARAALLPDVGDSAPEHWDEPWNAGPVHVLVAVNARSSGALDARDAWLRDAMSSAGGVTLLGVQDGARLVVDGCPSGREHFGYTDGFGDPDIAGSGEAPEPGRGKIVDGLWEPLAPGEFLLGYPDESGEIPPTARPVEFCRNGTFLVYRKLHQRVASFRRFLREHGQTYAGGHELLAARIVGRWRDGTPLMLSPATPVPGLAESPRGNDFAYASDPTGSRCPVGAHIRRANPRDGLGSGMLVNRHRILRRGIPYGSWTPLDQDGDDHGDHGMIFAALNASIERQFEFVNREWINYGNDFGAGNDKDILAGQHAPGGRVTVQGNARSFSPDPPRIFMDLPRFVVTRGGDYFFVPGLAALRMLANGGIDPS
jgi:Dyp-type peroxidase family